MDYIVTRDMQINETLKHSEDMVDYFSRIFSL